MKRLRCLKAIRQARLILSASRLTRRYCDQKLRYLQNLYQKNRLLRRQEEKLQAINDDLVQLNQDLEQRVLERTMELENLNHELKALNLVEG